MTEQTIASTVTPAPEMALSRLPAFQALPKMYRKGKKPSNHQRHQGLVSGAHGVAQLQATSRNDATAPKTMMHTCGVPQRGCTRAKALGSRPSTPAAKGSRERPCPCRRIGRRRWPAPAARSAGEIQAACRAAPADSATSAKPLSSLILSRPQKHQHRGCGRRCRRPW